MRIVSQKNLAALSMNVGEAITRQTQPASTNSDQVGLGGVSSKAVRAMSSGDTSSARSQLANATRAIEAAQSKLHRSDLHALSSGLRNVAQQVGTVVTSEDVSRSANDPAVSEQLLEFKASFGRFVGELSGARDQLYETAEKSTRDAGPPPANQGLFASLAGLFSKTPEAPAAMGRSVIDSLAKIFESGSGVAKLGLPAELGAPAAVDSKDAMLPFESESTKQEKLIDSAFANLRVGTFADAIGSYDSAKQPMREHVLMLDKAYGDHPNTAVALLRLGQFSMRHGRLARAERAFAVARDMASKTLGDTHPLTTQLDRHLEDTDVRTSDAQIAAFATVPSNVDADAMRRDDSPDRVNRMRLAIYGPMNI